MSCLRYAMCALCVCASLSFSCFSGEDSDTNADFLSSLVAYEVVPGFERFADEAALLQSAAAEYCDSPAPERLGVARDAWFRARAAWKRMDAFAFGPYRSYPERFGFKIDFWPARPDAVEELIRGDEDLDERLIGELGVTTRGLTAIEYVLFSTSPADEPRRCAYLVAATSDLRTLAIDNLDAWDPALGGYGIELLEPPGEFSSPHAAMSEVISRMGFVLEDLRVDSLGKPLGQGGGEDARPANVESYYSGGSLEDVRANLEGIERIFESQAGLGDLGIVYMLERRRRTDVITQFREALAQAHLAIDAIPEPLSAAVVEEPEAVELAIDALGSLQRVVQVDITNVLGAALSFNDTDGD